MSVGSKALTTLVARLFRIVGEPISLLWYQVGHNALSVLGLLLILVVVLFALFAPWIAPYNPISGDLLNSLQPPSVEHLMGTDRIGRDIFSRAVYGARVDLVIGITGTAICLLGGIVVGAVAGYAGGWIDEIIMRGTDILLSFPPFILAVGVAVALGGGMTSLIIALAVEGIAPFIRIMRGTMLSQKELLYSEAARAAGNSHLRIVFRHLAPNCLTPVIVQATLSIGYMVLDTAGLSFVGVGVKAPTAEWGLMIQDGVPLATTGEWWVSTFPGLMILITVLGFNLFGDALQTMLNPKARRQ